jgi:toxin ParE1/3/4
VKATYEKIVSDLADIIAYEIVAAPGGGEMVAILRVIHLARDWPAGKWPAE